MASQTVKGELSTRRNVIKQDLGSLKSSQGEDDGELQNPVLTTYRKRE
jgi:hypothetical protein